MRFGTLMVLAAASLGIAPVVSAKDAVTTLAMPAGFAPLTGAQFAGAGLGGRHHDKFIDTTLFVILSVVTVGGITTAVVENKNSDHTQYTVCYHGNVVTPCAA